MPDGRRLLSYRWSLRLAIGRRPIVGPALAALTTVGGGVAITQWITEGLFFLTSMVSSATLIATAPRLRQCHPARIVASHAIAAAVGLAMRYAFEPNALSIAASVGLALAIILFLDCLHPPALANAAIAQIAGANAQEIVLVTVIAFSVLAFSSYAIAASGAHRPGRYWRRFRG